MNVNLSTTYLGLPLRSPVVASASPLTGNLNALQRLDEAGVGAVVLPSLFEEQIARDQEKLASLNPGLPCESTAYVPELEEYNTGPNGYLTHIELAKRAVSAPVIASLNCATSAGWTRHARLLEQAGADALELNIYIVPTNPNLSSAEVEDRHVEIVAAVRSEVSIPLAVKICPFFTSLPHLARRLVEAGANGLVLFNRHLDPDIDLDTVEFKSRLTLSSQHELCLPLRWISILREQTAASLAATSGIHAAEDAIKALLAGADVAMMATALLRHGPDCLERTIQGIAAWMEQRGFASIAQLRGHASRPPSATLEATERAHYIRAVASYREVGH